MGSPRNGSFLIIEVRVRRDSTTCLHKAIDSCIVQPVYGIIRNFMSIYTSQERPSILWSTFPTHRVPFFQSNYPIWDISKVTSFSRRQIFPDNSGGRLRKVWLYSLISLSDLGWSYLLQERGDFLATAVGPRPRLGVKTQWRRHEMLLSPAPCTLVVIAIMREAETKNRWKNEDYHHWEKKGRLLGRHAKHAQPRTQALRSW